MQEAKIDSRKSSSGSQKSRQSDGEVSNTAVSNISAATGASASRGRKRKCLRLDVRHHRNVFLSTFYRIWMYRRRNLLLTLLQLLIPPLILVGMNPTVYSSHYWSTTAQNWTQSSSLSETALLKQISESTKSDGVITCYIHNNETAFARRFKAELEERLAESKIKVKMVTRKDEILKQCIHYHLRGESHKYIAGIEIKNPPNNTYQNFSIGIGDDFKFRFSIAMAQNTPGFNFQQRSLNFNLKDNTPQQYYKLLGLELAMCRTFYKLILNQTEAFFDQTNNSSSPHKNNTQKKIYVEIQSLPYRPVRTYTAKQNVQPNSEIDSEEEQDDDGRMDYMLTTVFVLSMVPAFFTSVEGPVAEKENGFKLFLQLMGYPRGAYWFSWILNQMLIQSITTWIQVGLIFVPHVLNPNIYGVRAPFMKYGDPTLWYFVLMLYNLSALSFFIFLSAFFRRGKMATYLGVLIWLLIFQILESHLPSFDFGSGLSSFMLSCLVPCGCIHWAVVILTTGHTNTWEASFAFTLTQKSGFRLADIIGMMIANFFLYFFLTLYNDNIHPGPLESGQPWNYFFEGIRCRFIDPNRDFIDGNNVIQSSEVPRGPEERNNRCSNCFREECNRKPAIEFKNISKKFHFKFAVFGIENVKFTAYSQRITVLLGHKDSGKTILLRLLCGEYSPTSGTAVVYGYDVKKNMQKAQSFFSICTEHNFLCEYLTVKEHMILIGKLQGLTAQQVKEKSTKILKLLDLSSQKNDKMWKLVTWQRRVLCLAMSFLGNAPILLLDDPTKNLEIDVKRQIWSLLKELKESGKTILMSTSDIDEAYQVADRIVIMTKGRVAGVGAPSKLETIFETGYHLTLSLTPASNKEDVFAFLEKHIPSIRELEGGLTQIKKAIQVRDWDQSQACLVSLPKENEQQDREVAETPSTVEKLMRYFFGPTATSEKSDKEPILELIQRNSAFSSQVDVTQYHYLLSFDEEANFPSLFEDLDNSNVMLKLGISDYEVNLHDMKTAFNAVDDYVDVLDAAKESKFEADFVDVKALRLFVEEPSNHMPTHERGGYDKFSCVSSTWALILKRMNHMIGNHMHILLQVLAPVLILIITIQSLNPHFRHRLVTSEINFNASLVPIVPYRMDSKSQLANEFLKSYKEVLSKRPNNLRELRNIGTASFESIKDENMYDELIIAADFTDLIDAKNNSENDTTQRSQKVTALFSPASSDSAPLSLLLLYNTILNYEFQNKSYSVELTGSSMFHKTETLIQPEIPSDVYVTLAVMLAFGYFIFTSGFVTQPCAERLSKQKRYQMYNLRWNGIYWLATAIVDMLMNIVTTILLTLVIYYLPDHTVFRDPEFITLFVITCTLGGFSSILNSYFWSHFLLRTSTSYYAVLSINQFFGLFIFLCRTIINLEDYGPFPAWLVTSLLPGFLQPLTLPWNFYYAIIWAMRYNGRCSLLNTNVLEEMCSKEADAYPNITTIRGKCCSGQVRSWNISFIWEKDTELLINVIMLLAHCIIGILLLMYMESRRLRRKIFYLLYKSDKAPKIKNDRDLQSILKEEKFAEEAWRGKNRDKIFIVRQVGTSNDRRDLLYPLSFAVEPGKCTAIVGPETSGITILYDILSGIKAVSEGSVTYGGHSLLKRGSRMKFLYQLGLCPASDITLDKMTGLQLLKLYGRLRGIPSSSLSTHTDYWVEALGLGKMIKKQCQHYSVVIKRKLAVALAVIGNPDVLIFDEPAKDLDPMSKFQVCKVLETLVNANRIVIILTHNLSSIERICSKLIFLINGQMQFCESTEAIYKEIAKQFTIVVELKGDELGKIDVKSYTEFKSNIESNIEGIHLQQEQSHTLFYRIQNDKATWGSLFKNVGAIVKNHSEIVLKYHIRRTNLQDVYDSYAVNQRVFRSKDSAWDEFLTTYC